MKEIREIELSRAIENLRAYVDNSTSISREAIYDDIRTVVSELDSHQGSLRDMCESLSGHRRQTTILETDSVMVQACDGCGSIRISRGDGKSVWKTNVDVASELLKLL